ncbi:GntR family transcriptional regulator [Catenulispora pinisilvae]|uniref:GntR family transcriptional regulator n=1 Tax=Catenulispora pinisilvae TaxID=2705253 RepID=UPI002B264AEC|nr:substrate-binding domain-containing protein [Catenulispora pinisilvae]
MNGLNQTVDAAAGRRAPMTAPAHEPKFQVIADRLREEILGGAYRPGSRLPTERDLARGCSVSISTVRRAVDDLVAESLVVRRQGSGTYVRTAAPDSTRPALIGVIVPHGTFYYPRVLRGIEDARAAIGARMHLACSDYRQDVEAKLVQEMLDARVDGLLIAPTLSGPEPAGAYLRRLSELPVPAVLMERRGGTLDDPTEHVCTHHEAGAYAAVRHLAALGHRNIGLALRSPSPTAAPVTSGYRQAVAEIDCPPTEFRGLLEEWGPATADRCLRHLLTAGCTAALCFGDRQAGLLVSAARRIGLRIPADLALVAYDDEIADIPEVPLTAVSPPKRLIGHTAAELLFQRLKQPDLARRQILLRPDITVRKSCGAG